MESDQRSVRAVRLAWPAAVVGLAAGAFLLGGDDRASDVAAEAVTPRGGEPAPELASTAGLSIREIDMRFGAEGAQDFIIVFDGPVPDDQVSYVEDITDVDAPAVGYTTQEWTPEDRAPLWTCGDQHFGFSPPVVVGQVDVLMPGDWFKAPPDTDEIIWKHDPKGQGLKTPLCGPHDGYVQLALWSPASHDPDDIRVYFDGLTRLVVEIRPGS